MKKEKLSVGMINMYCQVVRDKFSSKLNTYQEDQAFRLKLEKKYGLDKLRKKINDLQTKISKEVQKNSEGTRINKIINDYQMKIRLSTCPEEIKEVFAKLDKEL